jgi:CcmD family protein
MPIALLQATLPAPNLPFLFAAFAVTWFAFFAYAFFVSRKQQELRKEIAELRSALDQQEPGGGT